jgi:stage II sporulation protein D
VETETETPTVVEPEVAGEPDPEPESVPAPDTRSPARALRPIPGLIRVGLATDQPSVLLPCCDGDLVAMVGDSPLASVTGIRVEPVVEIASPSVFRIQIAALRDETEAEGLAAAVGGEFDIEPDVVFDAGSGLYRVRVGEYRSREEAEDERRRLGQRNIHDSWIVTEQAELREPSLRIRQGDRQWTVQGRWLEVRATSDAGIRILGKRFRGRILIYLNNRGTLNLINEVELDDYLRGVVPREMGPNIFDDLEALKAQAVAARTYTLRNIGEFQGEGYDICGTPRCQVYGGMDSEHELSDQAVLETTGEVLVYDGEYADALYSSTCGGHTENVEVVFPLKTSPYLRGVPCLESGIDRLHGDLGPSTTLEVGLVQRLLPSTEASGSTADFEARLQTLARMAGLATPRDRLSSLERREVQRFIASQLDLALDARLFVAREDIPYLIESPPPDWSEEDLQLAAYLVRAGLLSGPLQRTLLSEELDTTLFHLAVFLRVIERRRVRYLAMGEHLMTVKDGSEVTDYRLPERLATFRRDGQRFQAAPLALLPGDRLVLFLEGDQPLGVGHEADPDGVAFDRTSSFSSWTRFRTDTELRKMVEERYPGFGFEGLEILERGISGRVGKIRILGTDGQSVEVRGLPVRWTLDLPDTLFTARRLKPPGKPSGWLFTGRGWGHGVGMCQVGSYGMAIRGHSYRDILHHYYSGVELRKVAVASEASVAAGRKGPMKSP